MLMVSLTELRTITIDPFIVSFLLDDIEWSTLGWSISYDGLTECVCWSCRADDGCKCLWEWNRCGVTCEYCSIGSGCDMLFRGLLVC